MLIKVCGMRQAHNIHEVEQTGIDLMGFIFYPKSPRFVSMMPSHSGIVPDHAPAGTSGTAGGERHVRRVGVFVDDMAQNIITRVYNHELDYVQLHGSETPRFIDNLRRTIDPDIRPGIRFIKALSIGSIGDFALWKQYRGHADMLLFDTRCRSHGGSGNKFDWSLLDAYDGDIPFLLSGGIGPDDAPAIRSISHPQFAGIDLNSGFETEPGIKDVTLLRRFIGECRGRFQSRPSPA